MRSPMVHLLLTGGLAAAAVACSAAATDSTASDESGATGVLSCSAKHNAEAAKQSGPNAQAHWRWLQLPVMQPVAGTLSIRERMDALADDPTLGTRQNALSLAKRTASKLDLLSLQDLVASLNARYAFGLDAEGFTTDGTYTKPVARNVDPNANTDLRAALFLAKYVLATATGGVTETDVQVERARRDLAEKSWASTNIPLHGDGVTVDALVQEGQSGSGRFQCSTPGGNNLKTLAATADAASGADGKTSIAELIAYAQSKYGATWNPNAGLVFPVPEPPDTWLVRSALDCANQAFYFGGKSIQLPEYATVGLPYGSGWCGTVDLLAHQGPDGTTFTGHVVSVTMGQKDYEVVMMRASLLSPGIRGMLCLAPSDTLKLYVPYGKAVISECGLVNGMYRAAYYNLDSRVETDNWSPN